MFSLYLENATGNKVNIHDEVNYVVLRAGGFTPPPAEIYRNISANRKGSKYNGSNLGERNITLTIKLLGDVEANRNALYDYIGTENYVKVYYQNGVKSVYCEGYVEEVEIDFFTSNEVVEISIICTDPYLKDLLEVKEEIAKLLNQFTFPFAIESEGIPFSTFKADVLTTIYNAGVETGVKIVCEFSGTVDNFTIYNANDTKEFFSLKKTFNANEIVEINTDSSPVTVRLIKVDGTTENILKYVGANSTWLTMRKGINKFSYTASNEEAVKLTISFSNKHLGA